MLVVLVRKEVVDRQVGKAKVGYMSDVFIFLVGDEDPAFTFSSMTI